MKKIIWMISILVFAGSLWAAPSIAQDAKSLLKNIFPSEEQGIRDSHDALRQLINQTVVDSQGRNIGKVKNILIGESAGIDYLIIASSSGDRLIPVPWNIADPKIQDDRVQISLNREKLEDAPGFRSDEWPNFASSSIETKVHGYYGKADSGERDLDRRNRDKRDLNQ